MCPVRRRRIRIATRIGLKGIAHWVREKNNRVAHDWRHTKHCNRIKPDRIGVIRYYCTQNVCLPKISKDNQCCFTSVDSHIYQSKQAKIVFRALINQFP